MNDDIIHNTPYSQVSYNHYITQFNDIIDHNTRGSMGGEQTVINELLVNEGQRFNAITIELLSSIQSTEVVDSFQAQ